MLRSRRLLPRTKENHNLPRTVNRVYQSYVEGDRFFCHGAMPRLSPYNGVNSDWPFSQASVMMQPVTAATSDTKDNSISANAPRRAGTPRIAVHLRRFSGLPHLKWTCFGAGSNEKMRIAETSAAIRQGGFFMSIPERFGKYRILKPLDGGAKGEVYLSEHELLQAPQAAIPAPDAAVTRESMTGDRTPAPSEESPEELLGALTLACASSDEPEVLFRLG